jgi:hypothetical protein
MLVNEWLIIRQSGNALIICAGTNGCVHIVAPGSDQERRDNWLCDLGLLGGHGSDRDAENERSAQMAAAFFLSAGNRAR